MSLAKYQSGIDVDAAMTEGWALGLLYYVIETFLT